MVDLRLDPVTKEKLFKMKYCSQCGSIGAYRIPQGDDRPRFICDNCQTIHYQNPKLVVGCIPVWKSRLLMCRRAIKPRYGKWTIPAGFLEIGETVEEGAMRETYEETGAKVEIIKPYALYNLKFIGQVYLIFLSRLVDSNFRIGHESLEVRLFAEHEIAWDELAFPVIREVLQQYFKDTVKGIFNFHMGEVKSTLK
jgi:ADP-ribose pyrophosphatase YjhB (NUDIX family)